MDIRPAAAPNWKVKQPRLTIAPRVPVRALINGPSASGKTILLQQLILDSQLYRGVFEAVFIWSPSVHHDDAWKPVLKYLEEELAQDLSETVFDEYDPGDLIRIIQTQSRVAQHMKERRKEYKNKLYSVCVIVDDFADTPEFSRNSKALNGLYLRGRHLAISSIVATQKATLVSPTIRTQATSVFVFRIRNQQDLELIVNEFSALLESKKHFLDLYREATKEPFGFLYIDLTAKTADRMFFKSLKARLVP